MPVTPVSLSHVRTGAILEWHDKTGIFVAVQKVSGLDLGMSFEPLKCSKQIGHLWL